MNRIQFVETFVRREDAERFIEEVRGDEPELASYLRIEERELEAGRAELASATGGCARRGPACAESSPIEVTHAERCLRSRRRGRSLPGSRWGLQCSTRSLRTIACAAQRRSLLRSLANEETRAGCFSWVQEA